MGWETVDGYNTSLLVNVYPSIGELMITSFETLGIDRRHRLHATSLKEDNWKLLIEKAQSTLGLSEGENPNDPNMHFNLNQMGDIIEMLKLGISPGSTRVDKPFFFNEEIKDELGIDKTVSYKDPRVAREVFLGNRNTEYIDEVLRKALDRMLRLKNEEDDLQGDGVFIYGPASEKVVTLAEYGEIPANFALTLLLNELNRINQIPLFKIEEYRNKKRDKAGSEFNLLLKRAEAVTFLAVLRAWQILDPLPMKGDEA